MSSVMIPVVVVGCSLVDCWRKGVFLFGSFHSCFSVWSVLRKLIFIFRVATEAEPSPNHISPEWAGSSITSGLGAS